MTLSPKDIAEFLAARSRARKPAERALKELETRNVTAPGGRVRKRTPRAICDSAAQKAGRRLSELTADELADLLWPRPVGRPPLGSEPRKRYLVTLDPAVAERARAIGGGNLSGGLAAAVGAYATAPR